MSGIADRSPFVGPRPIQYGEPLYGRTSEVRELYHRLQARRIVVLHSPSGAGKSSLVHAGLIPKLKENNFDVWKPIRVNLDPAGLADIPAGTNRYLLSVQVSLEEELPAQHRRTPAQLARMDFQTYLETRPRRKGSVEKAVVLLFDQFEEVLTVSPRDVEEKKAFFDIVGKALDTGKYWALFIVRDDFLAALAPYRERLPTQLTNTFRLDLLDHEGAREAAEQLARTGGRTFAAVDQLIRDLSTIQVQQPDGSYIAEQGLYVEPVYLQVVCRQLWEAMPKDDLIIDLEDIAQYADVSKSLGAYYAQAVAKVAKGDRAVERSIREWVGSKLVLSGVRSQVRQEKRQSAGLANELIEQLLSSYLVRTEQRAGANWFELSHDRLVEPVQTDNQTWEQKHLHPMQVQAKLWESGRRSQALLLGTEALAEAAAWAQNNAGFLTEGETEYLELSAKLRAEERHQRRLQRAFMVALATVTIVAVGMGVWAWTKQRKAEAETKRAQDSESAALISENKARAAETAAMQARAAQEQAAAKEKEALTLKLEAMQRLDAAQRAAAEQARTVAIIESARDFLVAREGGLAALILDEVREPNTGGWKILVNETLSQQIPKSTLHHADAVRSAAWSPDGSRIVAASADGTARIWNANGRGDPIVLRGHTERINFVAWSPDGKRIVTASHDTTARIYSADGKGEVWVLKGHTEALNSAVFSPDGRHVVTASWDQTARIFETDGSGKSVVLRGHTGAISFASYSHDGMRIATAAWDRTARVFGQDGTSIELRGHLADVNVALWSPDDRRIATASDDNTVRIWNSDGKSEPLVLAGHTDTVNALAWSHSGKHLVSASYDWTARIWATDGKSEPIIIQGHKGPVLSAAWSLDDHRIVTGSEDGTAIIFDPEGMRDPINLQGHQRALWTAAFSQDGKHIATASLDKTVRIWNIPPIKSASLTALILGDAKAELTIPELKARLRQATTDCLLPATRTQILAESWAEARLRYDECEQRAGRGGADRDSDGIPDGEDRCPDTPSGRYPDPNRLGCSADNDGDGVRDSLDQCPSVPIGQHPNPRRAGCPDFDTDGDGIYDSEDQCPLLPVGRHVDRKRPGCPDKDSDGDGVYDNEDQCPLVPIGEHIDSKRPGCPDKDADGDGIYDSEDQCPALPAGARPDPERRGCPEKDSDGDGIYDRSDVCPDLPAGPHPDGNRPGCPDQDSDGDEIYDSEDRCPSESTGVHPDPRRLGCPDQDSDGDGTFDGFDGCPVVRAAAELNPTRPGCPAALRDDSDGDGVPDDEDLCPSSPAGPGHPDLRRRGCPSEDLDGDGVLDRLDRCPDRAGPREQYGCPWFDTDKDGIPDRSDKCPYEPGPAKNQGCPPPRKYIHVTGEQISLLQRVMFFPNRDIIEPSSFATLEEVALILKARESLRVRIQGHTADTGDPARDKWLSSHRARRIMRYLVDRGVPAERLSAIGYGSKHPMFSNRTAQGRADNSRVEFLILSQ